MLQAPNTDLFNPLVPKAPKSECQNIIFPLRIKPVKVNLKRVGGFYFLHQWVKLPILALTRCCPWRSCTAPLASSPRPPSRLGLSCSLWEVSWGVGTSSWSCSLSSTRASCSARKCPTWQWPPRPIPGRRRSRCRLAGSRCSSERNCLRWGWA